MVNFGIKIIMVLAFSIYNQILEIKLFSVSDII
jgi:hypothetical protein